MTQSLDFLVRRDDFTQTRWAEASLRADTALDPGAVLLRVDRFGLTTNNVTYAVVGDAMGYWNFFSAEDGWGRIPVWGFADVVASRAPGVQEGDRVYGYLPISTFLKVRADRITDHSFVDASEHRRALPAVYQQYARTRRTDPTKEDLRALMSPLFGTGFLIDDWLMEQALFGARQVIFASASSKTALAAAFSMSRRSPRDFAVVGLTSPRNRAFCERTGYYDRVVEYGQLAALPAETPTVLVDMACDAAVLRAVHGHFDTALKHSCLVGMTHQTGSFVPPADLPGPAPQLFFAPTVVDARRKAWGAEEFGRRVAEAQSAFIASMQPWFELRHGRGQSAIESAYRAVLGGSAEPNQGLILSF
jgi:hypothetical protein